MNVGNYVRTRDGFIGKIISIESNERIHLFQKSIYTDNYKYLDLVLEENIIKSSPNIIDLIEVGDYVNGNKIVHIQEKEFPYYPKRLLFAGVDENNIDDVWEVYNNEDIKSIVTKELFESMEYKVGD